MRTSARLAGWMLVLTMATGLASCGGGGGSSGGGGNGGGNVGVVSFNAAHSQGDLLTYTLDTANLTYTWTKLEGPVLPPGGSGVLTPLSGWGDYVYETDDGDTVLLLPNKLALVETSSGDLIAGVPKLNTAYTPSSIAGLYNYVGWDPSEAPSWFDLGTFEVHEDGTWRALSLGNLGDGANPDESGTWVDMGNGILHAYVGVTKVYNVMLQPAGDESVFVIDDVLYGGIFLGVRQRPLPMVVGTFDVVATDASALYSVEVDGGFVTGPDGPFTYQINAPWDGFAWYSSTGDYSGMDLTAGWHDWALMSPDGTLFGGGWETALSDSWIFAGIRR